MRKLRNTLENAPRIDADVRQIVEMSEFQAFVREFRLWKKRCPKCGGFTRGKMPPGSPKGAIGSRIQATATMLSGRFRLSRREAQATALRFIWTLPSERPPPHRPQLRAQRCSGFPCDWCEDPND